MSITLYQCRMKLNNICRPFTYISGSSNEALKDRRLDRFAHAPLWVVASCLLHGALQCGSVSVHCCTAESEQGLWAAAWVSLNELGCVFYNLSLLIKEE